MLEIVSVQTGARTPQLSLHSPELWTLSAAPSWNGLCLSAGLLRPHVLDIAENPHCTHTHTHLSAPPSSMSEKARQTSAVLSADSASPLRYHACFVYICLRALVCVSICLDASGRAAERAAESSLLLNLANNTLQCPVKKLEGKTISQVMAGLGQTTTEILHNLWKRTQKEEKKD